MEYLAEKSNRTRIKRVAVTTIFDEIIHKYSQSAGGNSLENMQPGQTVKGTDGITYTVVKDNTSGEKFFAPQQQQDPNQQQMQQQNPDQQVQDPNQYAMNPDGTVPNQEEEQNQPKQEPMGAKTSRRKAQESGIMEQDWQDLASMGEDIAQCAKNKNMRGIMEILEDLTDFALSFINVPEDIQ